MIEDQVRKLGCVWLEFMAAMMFDGGGVPATHPLSLNVGVYAGTPPSGIIAAIDSCYPPPFMATNPSITDTSSVFFA